MLDGGTVQDVQSKVIDEILDAANIDRICDNMPRLHNFLAVIVRKLV